MGILTKEQEAKIQDIDGLLHNMRRYIAHLECVELDFSDDEAGGKNRAELLIGLLHDYAEETVRQTKELKEMRA